MNIMTTPWYCELLFKSWALMLALLFILTCLIENRIEKENRKLNDKE